MRAAVHVVEAEQKEVGNNDADIDIAGVEKIGVYSDTDDSTDAMYYLPLDYSNQCTDEVASGAAPPNQARPATHNGAAEGAKAGTKRNRGGRAVN